MGWSAARKLRTAVDNLCMVLAVEYLTAARAIDLRAPLEPAPVSARAVAILREHVAGPGPDRFLAPDLQAARDIVASGAVAGLLA